MYLSTQTKIFIIGLPRTGTTSVCCKFLDLGYTVTHTAYTQKAFEQAQVIADTPVFSDFAMLFHYYPQSKFIYLDRKLPLWLPSIKQLLNRMQKNILRTDGGFNPIIKRCYQTVFFPFNQTTINDEDFLSQCYLAHKESVHSFFKNKPDALLSVDISEPESLSKLLAFIGAEKQAGGFEKINIGGKVTAWKDLKHSNKIESTNKGKSTALDYAKRAQ